MLLRAGSALPRNQIHIEENQYLLKIQRAGGFRRYEAQVKKSLAAMLVPKFPQIPAEVIPTIVEFWAHAGDYCMPFVPIDLDPSVARIIATLRIRPII